MGRGVCNVQFGLLRSWRGRHVGSGSAIAAEQVSEETAGLRVSVLPGGCSGFKYSLNIEEAALEDDMVQEVNGSRVFVDGFSAQYLTGVTVDYVTSMQGSGFTFTNPNASGGCGCGSSFTV